ncbi:hypothetical protein [Methylobacterium planeticum]|uniref:Uncharacterized protein n=1 Tax=Methylobacterium planeticum TaxID=2615211 RepID=A0A6N6MQH6_9HYPH|nr:hypothetical protein [Methylobacterium planeticum]KAB1073644.1 hypothetical protein F6X51_10645 [Methylobacterium planeticum]
MQQVLTELTRTRDRLGAEVSALEARRSEAQAQLARLTDSIMSQTRDLATLDGLLSRTRQEVADAQSKEARARQPRTGRAGSDALPPVPGRPEPTSPAPGRPIGDGPSPDAAPR